VAWLAIGQVASLGRVQPGGPGKARSIARLHAPEIKSPLQMEQQASSDSAIDSVRGIHWRTS
jgi:hypothetical protein